MKKIRIGEIISFVLALIAIIISITGFFDNFNPLGVAQDSIPRIILGLVGIMIINALLERRNDIKRIDNKLDTIIRSNKEENLNRLQNIANDIDPTLKYIFDDFINQSVDFFHHAIRNQKIEFNDLNRFKASYIRTLKYKKESTYYATSLPYERYFWKENKETNPMMNSMKEFINQGGRFERIFFIEDGDLDSEEVINILNKQLDLNINVFIINMKHVPRESRIYFVVDKKAELAWEVKTDKTDVICSTSFYTSKIDTKKYLSIYRSLKALDYLEAYTR